MVQCTSTALLPPPDHIAEQATAERPAEPGYVACELGNAHNDDDHAQLLWTEDERGGAIWARWNTSSTRIEFLPWCGVRNPNRDEACGLFTAHSAGHSWEVVDATREALKAVLSRQYPHLFLTHDCPNPLPDDSTPECP
ncbi:hypothetical protein [Streptomyces sp. NPDC051662]|uniref:hypothetical protein n=1 Tax=Streptomyces sp. NPDC051662 TaxID=3154750 RepID=UPI003447B61E